MRIITTSVFVDQKTARESIPPIVEYPGRPEEDKNKQGVYVGSVTTKVYEATDWATMSDGARTMVFDEYATIAAARTANEHRADVKNGGKLSTKKQIALLNTERDELITKLTQGDTSVVEKLGELTKQIQALGK